MKLMLAEPFKSLWAGRDAFAAVEELKGQVYRELEARRTLRTEVEGRGYFVKIHRGIGWGEILTLLATIFWALHILGVAYGSTRLQAMAFVQLQLSTCAVLSLAVSFIFERPVLFPGWAATGAVLWTGVMGSLVAYVLMVLGQRYTPPTLAGVLMSLEAVFALGFSILVGYDTITARTLLGFGIVFAGTTVARLGSEKAPQMAAEQAPPAP